MEHVICKLDQLQPFVGVVAKVQNQQVAIFMLNDQRIYALSNYDPFSQANVIARGITCVLQGKDMVSSPMYKQHFCLETGQCLEDADVCLTTYPVKVVGGEVVLTMDNA